MQTCNSLSHTVDSTSCGSRHYVLPEKRVVVSNLQFQLFEINLQKKHLELYGLVNQQKLKVDSSQWKFKMDAKSNALEKGTSY